MAIHTGVGVDADLHRFSLQLSETRVMPEYTCETGQDNTDPDCGSGDGFKRFEAIKKELEQGQTTT